MTNISLISFSKIFEKIMYNNVVNFMDKNDNLYIDHLLVQLSNSGYGCHVAGVYAEHFHMLMI